MPGQAYLTIDDSPSSRTDDLVNWLAARSIPAILFCRGDLLDSDPGPIVRAIEKGFVIGNHLYHHKSAGGRDAAEVINDIRATEELINDAYHRAGKPRPGRYIRFPYMDRDYSWFLPDSQPDQKALAKLHQVFDNLAVPGPANPLPEDLADKRACLQDYLIHENFTQPFPGITYEWYQQARLHEMPDCPFTVNTYDWMLTGRHLARGWPYQSMEDLQSRLRDHPFLNDTASRDIVLAHDQAEIFDVTTGLIAFMQDEMGIEFIGDFA
jgi:peptidoglycan/xylan/chitin deacetylase (PgdA/CDA1 family)